MISLYQSIRETLAASVLHALGQIAGFIPNLLSALVILVLGWLLAIAISRIARTALTSMRVDSVAERHGVNQTLTDVGLSGSVTALISGFVYWVLLLLTILPAVEALRLVYFTRMIARLVGYLPTVIAAVVILLVGLSAARFLSNSLVRTARKAGLEYAGALGVISRYFLSLIIIVITLAQLGVQTAILTVILAVILISAGLATAMALGYGSRGVVANILAGAFVREHFEAGRTIEVQGVRGTIISVNSVGTTLQSETGIVTVPNTVLMENVVE
jgi:small-conductance mechanosensitive channel